DATGLLATLAGFVLVGLALRIALAGRRRLVGVVAIPIVLVVLVQWAIYPAATAAMHVAAPRPAIPSGATLGLPGATDVTFPARDGVRLAAWYVPARNGAAVILLHGTGDSRLGTLEHLQMFTAAGYGVLAVDARGHGGSGGDAMDLGWWGDRDVSAAVTWLESRPDVVDGRVAAVGLSMGGEEAIGAAASDPRIRAVVAEGALGRGSMDDSWLAHDVQGLIERGTLAVQTEVADLLTSAPRPGSLQSALVAIAPRPVLLIAGRDELRGDRAYAAAAPAVELWELPDTAHVAGLATHPDDWTRRVTGFLDTALAGP
ncbi:MAG: alpha/beta hydrolase, partial [Acidimicrobiales bacterium]